MRAATTIRRVVFAFAAAIGLSACHQNGTVFSVNVATDSVDANPGDGLCADASGRCSLRAAVMEANAVPGVEEIRLPAGVTHVLTIDGGFENAAATGDLDITEGVVITGGGTIDATAILDRILDIRHSSGLVELENLDLRGTAMPGSIQVGSVLLHESSGALLVSRSDISGAAHPIGSAVHLGGGPAIVSATTMRSEPGEGSPTTLAIAASSQVTLANVTVRGVPTPNDSGMAVVIYGVPPGSTQPSNVKVQHSSILGAWAGHATISGSVVEECVTWWLYPSPLPTSAGRNVEAATSCGFDEPGDQQNTDALLGPLADNGGAVPTALPAPGSPAIDTGPCTLAVDGRWLPRPAGGSCDSGAVEVQAG